MGESRGQIHRLGNSPRNRSPRSPKPIPYNSQNSQVNNGSRVETVVVRSRVLSPNNTQIVDNGNTLHRVMSSPGGFDSRVNNNANRYFRQSNF